MSKPIVLTGGGTAGHVIPNLALLPYINSDQIHYIGSSGMEKELLKDKRVIYHEISATKLIRSLTPKNLLIPLKLSKAKREAAKIIDSIKPAVIFSKGGYVSLPVALAAKSVPLILHESDMSLGLANRLAMKNADKLLTAFDCTARGKAICVGAPLRRSIYSGSRQSALALCGFSDMSKPTLLIMGGSLGSRAINQAVIGSIDALTQKFNVVHVVGKGNLSSVQKPGYKQIEFTSRIEDLFALADLALSRGGANSLFELVSLGLPTLCIPLSKAQSRGDQIDNAEYFQKRGCIEVLSQDELTPTTLLCSLSKTYESRASLRDCMRMQKNIDGTKRIAEIINSYLK